jgi:hypothetical protein
MYARIVVAALLWLALSHFAVAQEPAPTQPPPSPPAKAQDVAWLAGYWDGEGLGGKVEDMWMPPRDGVVLGVFRLTKADGKGFQQLFAIEEHEGSLRFVFRHFHPDFTAWEEKDKPIRLRLTRIGPNEAAFGGVVFARKEDVLTVSLTMRGRDGPRQEVLTFKRRAL